MNQDTHVLEIETKYDVRDDAAVPGLTGLPHVDRVAAPATVELAAAYFDSAGLDLLELGITLRRRTGGTDAGWHLKLPADGGRHELRDPPTVDDTIPPHLGELLARVLRGARLREVGTITTRREVTALLDSEGHVIGELCDDRVSGVRHRRGLTPPAALRWREWELELRHADAKLATAAADRLVGAGARPSAYPSKLARTLGTGVPGGAGSRRAGRRSSAQDVLAPYLDAQVRRLRQLDPQVRADLPDAVHQMRVTCRRIRAVLACFRREFDRDASRYLRDELRWVVEVLGGERDLEVLRERLGALVRTHDSASAGRESWIDVRLSSDLGNARAAAQAALRSSRYDDVLDALADPAWPPWSDRAQRPSGPELRKGLRRELTRLIRMAATAERARGSAHDQALHDVRKAAKRLRYASEAVRPRFGQRAVELGQVMADLQDVLGAHHDEVVAGATVRRLEHERSATGLAGSTDLVLDDLDQQKAAEVETYRRVWDRLRAGDLPAWLR